MLLSIDGEYVKDDEGQMVVTKLNEELLSDIAAETDGIYARSTNRSFGLDEIMAQLDAMQGSELTLRSSPSSTNSINIFLRPVFCCWS